MVKLTVNISMSEYVFEFETVQYAAMSALAYLDDCSGSPKSIVENGITVWRDTDPTDKLDRLAHSAIYESAV